MITGIRVRSYRPAAITAQGPCTYVRKATVALVQMYMNINSSLPSLSALLSNQPDRSKQVLVQIYGETTNPLNKLTGTENTGFHSTKPQCGSPVISGEKIFKARYRDYKVL